ncbi:MAG: MlaD family protein [Roseiarcus sp.]|jgi:phospholipid/cholesterol/gamma-HCH transport system substrate-binding protein
METRANFVLIGAFTLAVIAGAFLFVLWFSGLTRISQHKTYEVLFTGSVSGLSQGSVVLFDGLRIGEVTQIGFVATDPRQVQVMIDVTGTAPIRKDTKARLEIQGLTGGAAIALTGGAPDAPPLLGENGAPPIIVAEPSELQNIMESVQSLSARAESVLDKADKLLSDNRAAIDDAIKNVDTFSKALSDNSAGISSTLADFESLIKSIDREKVATFVDGAASLGETVRDNKGNIDRMLKNASELAAKLNESADKIDSLMASLQGFVGSPELKGPLGDLGDAARSVRQFADDLDVRAKEISVGLAHFTSSGLREYEALAIDGRRTVNDLDRVLRNFQRNPNELIFGAKPNLPEFHGGP